MSREGQSITAGREDNGVDPACRVVEILATDSVEGKTLAPDAGFGSFVDAFDEAGEDTSMGVGGSGREKDGIRMPIERGDSALDRLLEMLGYPPVILLFEVTDCYHTSTGPNSELLLRW